jgi:hypothetical protein
MATTSKNIHLPQLHRQEETVASGEWYLILFEGRWSVTTGTHKTIGECYAEARKIVAKQYKIPADAVIRDCHGTWTYY